MKNVFHLSQKLFPFLRYLNFCSDFFDHVGKGLSKKAEVTFKICDVMGGQQTIAIHKLPNISRSNVKQTIKFGKLIECRFRYIFLEKA